MQTEYTQITFPNDSNIVYIIGMILEKKFVPFYIGESSKNIGRFGDYVSGKFSAPTDFKVKEAIKYLITKGYKVDIRYKNSSDRRKDEKTLISKYKKYVPLLNEISGYNYKTANKQEEIEKIHKYIDKFLDHIKNKQ